MIPKITHQTWHSNQLPLPLQQMRQQMMSHMPDWEHRFHLDQDCRDLIAHATPHLLPTYEGYPHPVQRVDMWRMVAVRAFGGFYLDLDMVVHKPLDDLLTLGCVFAEEKTMDDSSLKSHGHRSGDNVRIANYMFGAIPHHRFIDTALARMEAHADQPIRCHADILESTGPGLITQAYHDFSGDEHERVILLPNSNVACPLCHTPSCQFGDYASHLHMGSWRF